MTRGLLIVGLNRDATPVQVELIREELIEHLQGRFAVTVIAGATALTVIPPTGLEEQQ